MLEKRGVLWRKNYEKGAVYLRHSRSSFTLYHSFRCHTEHFVPIISRTFRIVFPPFNLTYKSYDIFLERLRRMDRFIWIYDMHEISHAPHELLFPISFFPLPPSLTRKLSLGVNVEHKYKESSISLYISLSWEVIAESETSGLTLHWLTRVDINGTKEWIAIVRDWEYFRFTRRHLNAHTRHARCNRVPLSLIQITRGLAGSLIVCTFLFPSPITCVLVPP